MFVNLILHLNGIFVHKPWGSSSYYLEHCLGLLIISLFDSLFESFDCYLLLLKVYPSCHPFLFAIFDPQYSLISSKFFLDLCMCFHSFWAMHTLRRNSHYFGILSLSAHFGNRCQWGRTFEGLKGIGLHTFVLF
jgi:hypothetical protein